MIFDQSQRNPTELAYLTLTQLEVSEPNSFKTVANIEPTQWSISD